MDRNSPVIDQVKPITKKATRATDEIAHRVIAMVRGISYEPHAKRKKFIMIAEAAVPALVVGLFIGRARSRN